MDVSTPNRIRVNDGQWPNVLDICTEYVGHALQTAIPWYPATNGDSLYLYLYSIHEGNQLLLVTSPFPIEEWGEFSDKYPDAKQLFYAENTENGVFPASLRKQD